MNYSLRKYFPYLQIFYFLLIEAISVIWLFSIPGDPKNELIMGFSLPRIFLLLFPILLTGAASLFLFLNHKNLTWQEKFKKFLSSDKIRILIWGLFLISALFFYLLLLPDYRLGRYQAYGERLRPVYFYIFATGFEIFILLLLKTLKPDRSPFRNIRNEKSSLIFLGLASLFSALIICFVVTTKTGLIPDSFAWTVAGAPLTIEQLYWVFVLYILAVGGLRLFKINIKFKKPDLWIFLLLWLTASLVWLRQPITWSAYLQEPASPNYEYYPNSDAATYVSGARYALLGEGINGGSKTDKPLYMAFLAGLHLISNGNYLTLAGLQTIILALGAGVIYLLGKELYNRDLGFLLAIFYIIYEGNANQATGHITAMYSKLFMSEPLMGFFILLVVYLSVKWAQTRSPATFYWMCGISAFATFIRPHGLFVFAGIFSFSVIPYLKNLRTWFKKYFWGAFVYLSALFPWLLTARLKHGYLPIFYKIERVLFNRFERQVFSQPIAIASLNPDIQNLFTRVSAVGSVTIIEKINWVTANFFNNIFKSLLIFPLSLRFDDLLTTINKPYWQIASIQSWQPSVNILFFIHLAFILTGLFIFWKKNHQAAFLPLVALTTYFLANAFARSSGGRHLYPLIWVVYTYYAAGILFLIRCLFNIFSEKTIELLPEKQKNDFQIKNTPFLAVKISFIFFILGTYIPFIDLGISPDKQKFISNDQKSEIYYQSGLFPESVQTLLEEGNIRILQGEIWYPIQSIDDKNELNFYSSALEIIRETPIRLTLNTSGKEILIPDRSNALIFQCGYKNTNTIKTLGIILLDTPTDLSIWDETEISNCHNSE